MSLRLASRTLHPSRIAPAFTRAYGGQRMSTETNPNATESESNAKADQNADELPRKPSESLQHQTAKEHERKHRAEQPVVERVKGSVKRAARDVKEALKQPTEPY